MGRAPCCDKTAVKKGPWSPEEDAVLKSYIERHGTGGNWISLPNRIGIKRCGKSCRLRWLNYLRPNLKHGGFTDEEDYIICSLYINIGSRWSIIASQLPRRTDNDIKNYWNTRLKKKLLSKQGKAFHQELNVKFEQETIPKKSSSSTQNQILMFHDENTKSPVNQTLCNHVVDQSVTSFALEEENMIKNPILEPFSCEQNKVWFDIDHEAAASSYHHYSSPSLSSMSTSSSSIGTNSSLQMSHYPINNNDQDLFFMAGYESLQAELFDGIVNNNNTQEFGFSGTETLNNNCLDQDISSFIDYSLYDNEF